MGIGIVGYAAATGGSALTSDGINTDFAVTGATWQELTFHVTPAAVPDGAQFWEIVFQSDDTNDLDVAEFEIDSVFVYGTDAAFGTNTVAGKTQQGLVPEADVATDSTSFLRGDGLWAGSIPAISAINTQNGAYTLVLSDGGKTIRKATSTASITHTIPANASVAFPIGTLIAWQNDGTVDLSIAITTDTLTGTDAATGTRTLGPSDTAVIQKVAATEWKYAASDL
jgi:hypothetical protein